MIEKSTKMLYIICVWIFVMVVKDIHSNVIFLSSYDYTHNKRAYVDNLSAMHWLLFLYAK